MKSNKEKKSADVSISCKIGGQWKVEILDKEGNSRVVLDWFDNLIVDSGLNSYGSSGNSTNGSLQTISVGTGTTSPDASDTGLSGSTLGSASVGAITTSFVTDDTDSYVQGSATITFGLGVIVGNATEVGVFLGNGDLFSRTLFKDGEGNPTSITVLEDEQLRLTYRVRKYVSVLDTTTSVGDYTITVRPARWGLVGGGWTAVPQGTNTWSTSTAANSNKFSSSTITTIDSTPSTNLAITSVNLSGYSSGSYSRNFTFNANVSSANGSIRSAFFSNMAGSAWQVGFDPLILKTNEQTLAVTFNITWARKE
jgi:hypothetical protein